MNTYFNKKIVADKKGGTETKEKVFRKPGKNRGVVLAQGNQDLIYKNKPKNHNKNVLRPYQEELFGDGSSISIPYEERCRIAAEQTSTFSKPFFKPRASKSRKPINHNNDSRHIFKPGTFVKDVRKGDRLVVAEVKFPRWKIVNWNIVKSMWKSFSAYFKLRRAFFVDAEPVRRSERRLMIKERIDSFKARPLKAIVKTSILTAGLVLGFISIGQLGILPIAIVCLGCYFLLSSIREYLMIRKTIKRHHDNVGIAPYEESAIESHNNKGSIIQKAAGVDMRDAQNTMFCVDKRVRATVEQTGTFGKPFFTKKRSIKHKPYNHNNDSRHIFKPENMKPVKDRPVVSEVKFPRWKLVNTKLLVNGFKKLFKKK